MAMANSIEVRSGFLDNNYIATPTIWTIEKY